jgi:glyoxylase I family protein
MQQLHHYAYKARDAEETRHFYEDILGLPLYHIIQSDYVPSTGEYCPYTHFFFRLRDGSFIAFFDIGDDEKALPSPNTPLWINHISFRVDSVQELENTKARLQALRRGGAGRDRPPHLQEHLFLRPQRHPPGADGPAGRRRADGTRKHHRPCPPGRMDRPQAAVACGTRRRRQQHALKPQHNDRPEYGGKR